MSKSDRVRGALDAPRVFRDVWAMAVFIIHMGINIALFAYAMKEMASVEPGRVHREEAIINVDDAFLQRFPLYMGASMTLGMLFILMCFQLMKRQSYAFVWGSFLGTVLYWSITSAILLMKDRIMPGVCAGAFAIILLALTYSWRNRMQLSALLLEHATTLLGKYPGTMWTAALGCVLEACTVVMVLSSWMVLEDKASLSEGQKLAVAIYSLFSMYWTHEVFKNTVHVTVCGVFAEHYFAAEPPSRLTARVLGRSLTYSFGSICFGSLLVALIQTLRIVLEMMRDDDSFVGACFDCLIWFVKNLVQYFNYFAFTEIAIYGKPYIQAASDTWDLIKRSGLEIIINDNLLGNVVFVMILATAIAGGFGGWFLTALDSAMLRDQRMAIAMFSGLFSAMVTGLIMETVHSGVTATIVCYCEDPDSLKQTKPELYNRFYAANHATMTTP